MVITTTTATAVSTIHNHGLLKRVVVTGIGAVTPLGNTLNESWKAVLNKTTGVDTLENALRAQGFPDVLWLERELDHASKLSCQVAAPVRGLSYDPRTSRMVQMISLAARQAMEQAKLVDPTTITITTTSTTNSNNQTLTSSSSPSTTHFSNDNDLQQQQQQQQQLQSLDHDRMGVCIGSGMAGLRELIEAQHILNDDGWRRLSPHTVPKLLTNTSSGRLAIAYQLRGPNLSVTTACAAGAQAIIDGMRCIQLNQADVMVVGGAEGCINPLSIASFSRLRALSTRHDPLDASRPFDKDRDGFVMAEGAAVLVLEEEEHARRRQARILARVTGYGMTGDAFHSTAPDPQGRGAQRAMRMAMDQAQLDRDSIQYINAHATSTPMGDEIEGQAIHDVFFDAMTTSSTNDDNSSSNNNNNNNNNNTASRTTPLWVSSTKGATGHLLGAAGALEAALCVQALIDQTVPPCCNLDDVEDNSWGFQLVQDPLVVPELRAVMTNSFGFGGTNACIIFEQDHNGGECR